MAHQETDCTYLALNPLCVAYRLAGLALGVLQTAWRSFVVVLSPGRADGAIIDEGWDELAIGESGPRCVLYPRISLTDTVDTLDCGKVLWSLF